MERYADLLLTTYSDRDTVLTEVPGGFDLVIRNPEQEDGDITVAMRGGRFTLRFFSMDEELGKDFGELVSFIDEILADESMIFEVYSHGENVLGGSRGTDEIDIDTSLPRFVRSLADGDPCLYGELREIVAAGRCHVRLRGWRRERRRSIILS